MALTRVGVLVSGRGSNLQAIIDACENGILSGKAEVVVVVSDKEKASALERARKHGIDAVFVNPQESGSREEFDRELVKVLNEYKVDLVLLAGYMRIVGPEFVKAFENMMMNIHPALLPCFPGLDAQKQALDHGVKYSGCTVHFVDEEVDAGPIIIQSAVPVLEDDNEASLSKRILEQEYIIYPEAVRLFVEGKLRVEGRRVHVLE